MSTKKILIIRFSSIGDIVLTTPVIRCVKQQIANAEIHFVTKKSFLTVVSQNPYLDKIHTFDKDVNELYEQLKSEKFDIIIDLHKNLRSLRLKRKLGGSSFSFNKINFVKFLVVNFKWFKLLPPKHIVQRYLDTVRPLNVFDDQKGLDYFIDVQDEVNVSDKFFDGVQQKFIALVVGGSYYTKKIPIHKLEEIIRNARLPVVLLGGPEDKGVADNLKNTFPQVLNACGDLSLNQSASVIKKAEWVITSDTGLMHIAAAFNKKIISVWGNTIPEFGMGPYMAASENIILEVKHLPCRPCSKLGYKKCPLGHFKCMNEIDYKIVNELQ